MCRAACLVSLSLLACGGDVPSSDARLADVDVDVDVDSSADATELPDSSDVGDVAPDGTHCTGANCVAAAPVWTDECPWGHVDGDDGPCAAQLPVFAAPECPEGWSATPIDDAVAALGPDYSLPSPCRPPTPALDCAGGSDTPRLGSDECVAYGACESREFDEGYLRSLVDGFDDAAVRRVPTQDADVQAALAAVSGDIVIAIDDDAIVDGFTIHTPGRRVALVTMCPNRAAVASEPGGADAIDASSDGVELHIVNVAIIGGVYFTGERMTVRNAMVSAGRQFALAAGGSEVMLDRVHILASSTGDELRAIRVLDDVRLVATDVSVTGGGPVAIDVASGANAHFTDLIVDGRSSRPTLATVASQGSLRIDRFYTELAGSPAFVLEPDAQLEVSDAIIRDVQPGGWARTELPIVVTAEEASATFRRTVVEDTPGGLARFQGGTLTLEDVVLARLGEFADTGRAELVIELTEGADLRAERVLIHQVTRAGFRIDESSAELRDVLVHDLRRDDVSRHGSGLYAANGATLSLDRVAFDSLDGVALALGPDAAVTAADLVVDNVARFTDPGYASYGFYTAVDVSVDAERVVFRDIPGIAIQANETTEIALSEALFERVPSGPTAVSYGVSANAGGILRIRRALARESFGAFALATFGTLEASDFRFAEHVPGASRWAFAFGNMASTLRLERVQLDDVAGTGVVLYGPATEAELIDVAIRDPVLSRSAPNTGRGVELNYEARARLERVEVSGARDVAVAVLGDSTALDASGLRITGVGTDGVPGHGVVVTGGALMLVDTLISGASGSGLAVVESTASVSVEALEVRECGVGIDADDANVWIASGDAVAEDNGINARSPSGVSNPSPSFLP